MKLLLQATARLVGFLIIFSVLATALSVIAEHCGDPANAPMPLAAYEHEYIGDEALTILGKRIELSKLSRFLDDTWQLICNAEELLPHDLERSATGVLGALRERATSVIQVFINPHS